MLEYKIAVALTIIVFVLLVDLYSWQGFKTLLRNKSAKTIQRLKYIHYTFGVFVIILFISTIFITKLQTSHYFRTYVSAALVIVYIAKLIQCIFLLIDDIQRLLRWVAIKLNPPKKEVQNKTTITRAKFLATTGSLAGGIPLIALTKGIFKGAYDYQIHRVPLYLKKFTPSL